jgi:hypothetical protein
MGNVNPSQKAELAGLVPPRAFIVTVHGIGPYATSSSASKKLITALPTDIITTLQPKPVDFNWYDLVEARLNLNEKVTQLSRSIIEAAHLCTDEQIGSAGYLVRGAGFLLEALFKLALFSIPVSALLLILAIPIYVDFGAFGLAGTGTSLALRCMAALWKLVFGLLSISLMISVLLCVLGLRLFATTLLRRATLVLLQPVIPLAYRLGNAQTTEVLKDLMLLTFFYVVAAGMYLWFPDAAAQWYGLNIKNLSVAAAGLALIYFISLGVSKVISEPVKLARDIFNYIGDVQQRTLIQQGLSQQIKDKCGEGISSSHVILVGHSLGSVIALDSLCNSNVWARFSTVSLVTCGSPIFRFFQRFFPGLYFPREAEKCVLLIQSRNKVVRWLNVFRADGLLRGDPVGQALFSRGGSGTDLAVHQRSRILMKAHLDYWDDEEVIATVGRSWHQTLPLLPKAEQQVGGTPVRHGSLFDRLHRIAQRGLIVFAVVGLVFALANAFTIVYQQRAVANNFLSRAVSNGIETRAKVTHSITYWGYGKDISWPVQVYQFEFIDRSGQPRRLIFDEDESDNVRSGLYFDSAALRERFGIGEEESKKTKKTFEVQILYLEEDMNHLTLADPSLRPNKSDFPIVATPVKLVSGSFWPIIFLLIGTFYASRQFAEAILPRSVSVS